MTHPSYLLYVRFTSLLPQNPFNVVRTVFDPREGERELTLFEKSDLFFHDYGMASLFVQENYIRASPHSAK